MSFASFVSDTLATVLGGALLALFFFLLQDKIFGPPDINGVWSVTNVTKKTSYNPYKDMELSYKILVWQAGTTISGSTEKLGEKSKAGQKLYEGVHRTRGRLDGSILKRYLSRSEITIHLVEEGQNRDSSAFFQVECVRKGRLEGTWQSTAADSSGTSVWERDITTP